MAVLGWILCLLLAVQAGVGLLGACFRFVAESRERRLRIFRAREEIAALQRSAARASEFGYAWDGWRKFRIERKVEECPGCHSLYLAPHDGKPLPLFQPGQYVTLAVRIPGEERPIHRCYSLSDAPRAASYRCTIKQVPSSAAAAVPQPGRISTYLNSVARVGDILDVQAPRGSFVLDPVARQPIVLLGGGIGITPLVSMFNTVMELNPEREILFVAGFRNGREHPFRHHLQSQAARHASLQLEICYSKPLPADQLGTDYHQAGHVSVARLKDLLPSSNYDYFICGPAGFMSCLTRDLQLWGVPKDRIHTEAFGPGSVPRDLAPAEGSDQGLPDSNASGVRFDRSGKGLVWNHRCGSLLEFAEQAGIAMDAGCRTGSCGTCATAVKSGSVRYSVAPDFPCEEGVCLPCICVPAGDLVLDA